MQLASMADRGRSGAIASLRISCKMIKYGSYKAETKFWETRANLYYIPRI